MEKYVYICYTKLYTGGHLFIFDTQQPVYYKQKILFFNQKFYRICSKLRKMLEHFPKLYSVKSLEESENIFVL